MDDYIVPPKLEMDDYHYTSNDKGSYEKKEILAMKDPIQLPPSLSTTSKYNNKSIVPELRGLSMRKAINTLHANGFKYKIKGNGQVEWQSPKPGEIVDKETICIIGMQ